MPRLAPLVAAVIALSASGCGAEAVPEEAGESVRRDTARVVTVTRMEVAGKTHESRTTSLVDYDNDRTETVSEETGCRWITISNVTYAEMTPDARLPPGKLWVRFEPPAKTSEQTFEESLEPRSSDDGWTSYGVIMLFAEERRTPTDYLDYLREVAGELDAVGEEIVDGAETTRYRTSIDVIEKTRRGLTAEGWKAHNIERYLETVAATTEQVDVWVDADGRVRKTVTSYLPSQMIPSRTTTTTEYLDLGRDVAIEPPPAEAVLDEKDWRNLDQPSSAQLEGSIGEVEEGSAELPGSFVPTEPVAPPRCLH